MEQREQRIEKLQESWEYFRTETLRFPRAGCIFSDADFPEFKEPAWDESQAVRLREYLRSLDV